MGTALTHKSRSFLQVFLLLGILLTSYTNCSPGFKTAGTDLSSVSSMAIEGGLCETSLGNVFQRGYYQFLRNNCATCHATDSDKAQFASPDLNWAYKTFKEKGYSKVSNNAISSNHNPPYSGPQHIQQINELKLEWQQGIKEYNQCQGSVVIAEQDVDLTDSLSLASVQKPIPNLDVDKSEKITWDLNSEILKYKDSAVVPVIPGARLSLTVTRHKTAGGEDFYVFTRPIIFGSSVDINIKTMYLKINGMLMKFPTTFKFIDTSIRKGSKEDISGLISTGGMTVPGAISSRDSLSVSFAKLEPTVLPDPAPPVSVSFTGPKVRFVDSTTGSLDFEVALSAASQDPVTLTIEQENSALCGATTGDLVVPSASCLPELYSAMCDQGICDSNNLKVGIARSIVGTTYNRFDWDYKMKVDPITMMGLQTKSKFSINFSKDIRREENRLFRIRINIASTSAQLGADSLLYILIRKADNPVPAEGEITLSKLMSIKGILNMNCVKCHNSKDFQGGFDLTNYELMISKNIIIPGSNQSKMFKRINANDPSNANLTSMPLDGFLPDDKIDVISNWILNGAKNN